MTAQAEYRDNSVMKSPKDIFKKFIFLPFFLILPLIIFSTVSLVYVFSKGLNDSVFAYVSYAVSAYTLTVACIYAVKTFPAHFKIIKQRFYEHPYGNKYMTDIGYKVRVSLYISLAINIVYSVFKLVSGIIFSSFWWGAIAVYYIILTVIRFSLLKYMRSENQSMLGEWKRYRLCGILTVLLNLSLSGIVFQMVWQNKAYSYPEIIVIASAAYTFYSVTVSVIDMIKYRKYNSPVMSASKAIRFAAALVSLLTLETAMLTVFGEKDNSFNQIMIACTGAAVCIIVLTMSVFMIIKSSKEIKKIK